jgi:hypothetical protein
MNEWQILGKPRVALNDHNWVSVTAKLAAALDQITTFAYAMRTSDPDNSDRTD